MSKKYHLEIPKENISKKEINKTGFGETIPRFSYSEHGIILRTNKEQFKENEFLKKDLSVLSNFFLQLTTLDNINIKLHVPKIENLGFELVSLNYDNKSIANFKIDDEKFHEFEAKLEEYISSPENKYKTYFSAIESIRAIPNETKISKEININSEDRYDILINFFDGIKNDEINSLERLIRNEFAQHNFEYNFSNIANRIVTIKTQLNGLEISTILNEFNSIKEITLNQNYFITNSVKGESITADITFEDVLSSSAICIFDSGITNQGNIIPNYVRNRINSYLPSGSTSPQYTHGTFVASRCIYGDDIEFQITTKILKPYCYVIDVPVFGIDSSGNITGLNDFDLAIAITEVVESLYNDVKVYNLSLGNPKSLEDNERSHLGKTLDFLSKEFDVLFVISSGNINSSLGDYPDNHFSNPNARIGSPAESLLGLTVGSIAKYDDTGSLTKRNLISPFSKIGPGTDGGLKPELVSHGGNLMSPYTSFHRISSCGLYHDGMSLSYDNGTSFSSPIISRYAQMLYDYYPFAKTNLVKALLIHFAERREIFENFDFDFKFTGFGEPLIQNALFANNTATYLYQGELDMENYDYVKFNIPNSFSDSNSESKLKLKITIVYNPEVNLNNDSEYSKTRLSVKLVKNTTSGLREISLSNSNIYTKQWSPILQFEKSFTRNFDAGEWEVALRLYTRSINDSNFKQDYAIIIEVIDETGKINVYDEIKNDENLNYNSYENEVININYA
ncbi:S8 family peptidase [Myroides odoratimimus]|uniref:S8 family peptidase n=1 Tax=Myroides odoratimimus TaxID=76832 RepID=UPI0025749036|nr:S8 family peptidase [Myroides odoratimimus]MDM1067421.1 S8 family peptidase [Myroides odoratimimus]